MKSLLPDVVFKRGVSRAYKASCKVPVKCTECRSPIMRRVTEMDNHEKHFCSQICKINNQRTRKHKKCPECNSVFYPCLDRGLTFCSRKCYDAQRARKSTSYPKIKGRHAHRVVMEKKLGRKLSPNEIVHHRDENKKNFKLRNLKITTRAKHARHHWHGVSI